MVSSMSLRSLEAKRVLIVGGVGTGSIGRAITRAVAAAGASGVAVTGRSDERVREAAAEICTPTCKAVGIVGDVLKLQDIERTVAESVRELGGRDVLITNVGGIWPFAPAAQIHETTDESWDLVFDVNVRYVFRYCRETLKVFLEQRTGGVIVSVGSIAGAIGSPCCVAYGASKAALINMCKSLTAEYARRGIRMNVLNCGAVGTTASSAVIEAGGMTAKIPMGRAAKPEEIGEAVVFLASPMSQYMSGQAINFDGGITSRYPMRLPKTDESMAG
jgi:3-oxoacyl-[acyl-carrier protein] reductase